MAGNEWVGGTFGNALVFDGVNDYVEIVGYPGVTGGQSRTVAAWIKTDDMEKRVILSWGDNAASGINWIFRLNSSATQGNLGALRVAVSGGRIVGTTDVSDNQWHHVAAVLQNDGTPDVADVQLYVDGVLEGASHVLAMPINTAATTTVKIEAKHDLSDDFKALLDEVSVYDRALSPQEIEILATRGCAECL